jgi:hypothetical protein
MVARGAEVLRITMTAANTDEEVDELLAAFAMLGEQLDLGMANNQSLLLSDR